MCRCPAICKRRNMSCFPCVILYLFFFFFFNLPRISAVDFTIECNGSTYSPSGKFAASLSSLFSSLTLLSSTSNSGNFTSGGDADTAYGLYMCQGDLSPSACRSCIHTATIDINQSCSLRGGIIWYEFCQLRYADFNFFGIPVTDGHGTDNPNEETSSQIPIEVLTQLVQVAPLSKPLMFARNSSNMHPLFAQAQCSSDLSSDNCSNCLATILGNIKECCAKRKGWRFFTPSCWIRYEPTPYFGDYPNATKYNYIIRSQCSSNNFLSSKQANLKSLLFDLKTNAPATGFYTTSAGDNTNKLHGLALCGVDVVTPSECTACLDTAGRAILDECPNKTNGFMWYAKCFLKYSEQKFFGVLDSTDSTYCGAGHVSQEIERTTVAKAQSLIQVVVEKAFMFAADKVVINDTVSSYLLLQCTRDLSSENCQFSLNNGLSKITQSYQQCKGWQYLSGSCNIRYEAFPFFNETALRILELQPEEGGQGGQGGNRTKTIIIAILVPTVGATILGFIIFCSLKLWRRKGKIMLKLDDSMTLLNRDLTFMDLASIQVATNNFSDQNKLGEGGFGPVYKGTLPDRTEIAVKRLSQKSKQGSTEFMNEVKLIAKVQHRSLVRMLGYCVEGKEKLLIYEYLPNKSLDVVLFDPEKRAQLNWERRFTIILGIAKGLLYLHEDSLLKVIHRDLKASNVLLDDQMNPKISDFGLAKIYMTEESEVGTNRIVGTYGYMAPEYAMDGIFSVKSDVFSYGVLLLEIISGERNGRAHFEKYGQNLLKRAWDLWNMGNASEFIDPLLEIRYSHDEAMKCIHIGLLCIEENAIERPTMSAVLLMLTTDSMDLPQPGPPPNYTKKWIAEPDILFHTSRSSHSALQSINEMTATEIDPSCPLTTR